MNKLIITFHYVWFMTILKIFMYFLLFFIYIFIQGLCILSKRLFLNYVPVIHPIIQYIIRKCDIVNGIAYIYIQIKIYIIKS